MNDLFSNSKPRVHNSCKKEETNKFRKLFYSLTDDCTGCSFILLWGDSLKEENHAIIHIAK